MAHSVRPRRWQPTRLLCPWDSPGKNTRVGCHFPLQCMKVKSESEGTQSCPTLSDPMDCSLPGSSIHGIFQARVLEWVAIAFSVSFSRALKGLDDFHPNLEGSSASLAQSTNSNGNLTQKHLTHTHKEINLTKSVDSLIQSR